MTLDRMTRLALVAVAAAVPSLAHADPPKEVKDMDCLVGNWKAAGTVSMGKDQAPVKGTWKCARTPGKWGVACAGELGGIPGLASYLETDLFGYEPGSAAYHWFAVTNAGETHDHVAAVPTGNHIEFVYQGTQDGKPYKEVIDWDFAKDGKSFTLRSESFVAGASVSVLDLKARK